MYSRIEKQKLNRLHLDLIDRGFPIHHPKHAVLIQNFFIAREQVVSLNAAVARSVKRNA